MSTDWLVEPGYEAVRDVFVRGAGSFGRGGGAYCAYVGGRPVVDLWAGEARPGHPWQAGTTTVIMSATKGFAALCLQLLADRGELDVEARVTDYWPEFGQSGKEATLVRHVLTHTAGVLGFPGQTDVIRLDGSGWDDYDAIAAGFAAAAPEWEPGTRHGYHALSFGWLAGEIVRRVSGRSLGSYFHEEVARPLGLEAWIGTPEAELARVAHVYRAGTDHFPGFLRRAFEASVQVARDPSKLSGKAFLGNGTTNGVELMESLFNDPRVLRAEFPAGGGTANARALARLWAVHAGGGAVDGVRLLSEQSVARFGRVVLNQPDVLMAEVPMPRMLARKEAPVPRTLGYLGNGPMPGLGWRFGPNPAAYGVEGMGGQFGFCDPDGDVAVGYVRSDCAVVDVLQPALTSTLYACARRLGADVHVVPRPSLGARATGAFLRRRLAVPARPAEGQPGEVQRIRTL
jgi:CubicO group peptidase (beta-lactamase class C family)